MATYLTASALGEQVCEGPGYPLHLVAILQIVGVLHWARWSVIRGCPRNVTGRHDEERDEVFAAISSLVMER